MKKFLAAIVLSASLVPSFAGAVTLGTGCTTSTVQPGSSDSAGKILMGPNNPTFTACTMTFANPAPRDRACVAIQDLGDDTGLAQIEGGGTPTKQTMVIGGQGGWVQGRPVSYLCQSY